MITYKKVDSPNGVRYVKNNRITSTERVPASVVEKLEMGIPEVEIEEATKPCLVCDDQATKKRYVNMVIVELCEYHYYSLNLGKLAQFLREKGEPNGENAKVSKTSKQKSKPKARKSQKRRQDTQERRKPGWGERIEIE